jgi:hypothetical protein
MNLSTLSRCTGFPPAVLRNFVAQGVLPLASTKARTDRNEETFDGEAFLRNLVEMKNAR